MERMNPPDREKVIERLNNIHAVASGVGGDKCWLNGIGIKELQTLINDATALLKPPAPRLLTAEDFKGLPSDDPGLPCWKENKKPTRRNGWAVIVYGKWLADQGVARYWTDRPTDEQREAEPWKE